jgi:hypothetical protein
MNQQRRLVIKALAVGGAAAAVLGGVAMLNQPAQDQWQQWLSKIHADQSLIDLLAQFDDPVQQLLGHLQIDPTNSSSQVESAVKQAIVADFNADQTVVYQQWYLSLTEALIIASTIALFGSQSANSTEQTFANAPFEPFMTVTKWGPQETYQGVKFNEQPDGHCGFWVVAEDVPDSIQIYVAGKQRNVVISERGLTSGIYDDVDAFINQVGTSEIIAYDVIGHRKQKIGEFTVLPPFAFHQYPDQTYSAVFSEISNWGPQQAKLGEAFNVQPNGFAAFWVKGTSRSNDVMLRFNQKVHQVTVRKEVMTTSFSPNDLPREPGRYPVALLHESSDEELILGDIEILPQQAE